MKISVIVPAFNAGKTIAESLASVVAQTQRPEEIIVVDDGSSDDTRELASRVEGVTIRSQTNAGVAAAMNFGIASSTGDLIAFLDADDLWTPRALASQLSALGSSKDDAAIGQVEEFVDDPINSGAIVPRPVQTGWLAGATLLTRSMFTNIGMFDPDLRIGAWIDWIDRAKRAGGRFHIHKNIVLLRRLRTGTLSSANHRNADLLQVARRAIARRRLDG